MSLTTRSIYGDPLLSAPVPAGYHAGDVIVDAAGVVPGFAVLVGPALAPVPVYVPPGLQPPASADVLQAFLSSTGPGNRTVSVKVSNPDGPVTARSVAVGFGSLAPALVSVSAGAVAVAATPVEGCGNGTITGDTLALTFNGLSGANLSVIVSTLGPRSNSIEISTVIP